MSKPTFDLARPAGADFQLLPTALNKWDAGVQASGSADNNVISILDPIGADMMGGGVTAKRITAALRSIGDSPVTVQINSPGGDFFEGLAIYNALAQHTDLVTVQIIGIAASAASIIAMAGDRVEIAKAGVMMIHNTQWVAIGDRHMMTDTAAVMAKFDEIMAELYAARSTMSAQAAAKLMDAETWLSGQDAIDKGFANAFLGVEPDKNDKVKQAALYRVEQLAAASGMSRSQARSLMNELVTELGKPGATPEAMPRAGDEPDFSGLADALKSFRA